LSKASTTIGAPAFVFGEAGSAFDFSFGHNSSSWLVFSPLEENVLGTTRSSISSAAAGPSNLRGEMDIGSDGATAVSLLRADGVSFFNCLSEVV
jgi:hypothetical protein